MHKIKSSKAFITLAVYFFYDADSKNLLLFVFDLWKILIKPLMKKLFDVNMKLTFGGSLVIYSEWLQALKEQYTILPLIYTDGGPDHQCTFGSVHHTNHGLTQQKELCPYLI